MQHSSFRTCHPGNREVTHERGNQQGESWDFPSVLPGDRFQAAVQEGGASRMELGAAVIEEVELGDLRRAGMLQAWGQRAGSRELCAEGSGDQRESEPACGRSSPRPGKGAPGRAE